MIEHSNIEYYCRMKLPCKCIDDACSAYETMICNGLCSSRFLWNLSNLPELHCP